MKRNIHTPSNPASQVHEALRSAIHTLQTAHVESASLDARILLQHVLGISYEEWVASHDFPMSHQQFETYSALAHRRAQREPITHLTGKREFWGMDFKVTPATLDPRPDSETLVDAVLKHIKDRNDPLKILDLGTGTGCLLLSLLKELPEAEGTGIDLSREALAVAHENAEALGLGDRCILRQGNWCEGLEETYDIVISNPPYIPSAEIPHLAPEVSQYEPKLALDGGADGLGCYRNIIKQIGGVLKPEGFAAFEIGMRQFEQVALIAESHGLDLQGVSKDLQGIVRCIIFEHTNHKEE